MRRISSIILLSLVLLVPLVHSQETVVRCLDNETLQHNITYEYCVGERCRILSDVMEERCEFGCNFDTNSCNPASRTRLLWVGGIVVFLFISLIVFTRWY